MGRLKKNSTPGLRHHKASGRAVVTLSGQDFYCGKWGTAEATRRYNQVVAEWWARHRRPTTAVVKAESALEIRGAENLNDATTVTRLIVTYVKYADGYYRKNGEPTSEVGAIKSGAKIVREMYGRQPANDFTTLKLMAVQQAMVRLDWTRENINKQSQRIVRMFSWGVTQMLVRPEVVAALREVPGLHKGRTTARETARVVPVEETVVQATLPHLPPIVSDMVRLQRLTGCRPEEVCLIRPCDVDASGDVWAYRPESHKTEHHERERVIFIGPKGQDVLRPYLLRDKAAYCFSPAESERKRRESAHEARRTPLQYGNRPGTNKAAKPKRRAGARYTSNTYRRAIQRACELAFKMPEALRVAPEGESPEQKAERSKAARKWRSEHCWAPNRLRHAAGTEIRKRYGLEGSQVVLGHSHANVTQIYAERDLEKAASIMREVG
jgi:integrase